MTARVAHLFCAQSVSAPWEWAETDVVESYP
jgi:hypothetical protein